MLANRTGVNTGEVVANDDPTADQKLATGDAVNVTARLEQAAPANEIYSARPTYRLVRDAVEVESVEPLELKGKSERVAAFRLVSLRPALDGYVRRHDSAIVGRDEQLAAIDQALREVAGNARRAHDHARRRRRHRQVAPRPGSRRPGRRQGARSCAGAASRTATASPSGRCARWSGEAAEIRFDDNAPRQARRQARDAGRRRRTSPTRLAAAIGLSRRRLPAARDLLGVRASSSSRSPRDGPLIALVDDIHWAESAFLDLLVNVLDTSEGAPILLLCTSRHELLEKRPDWGERARRDPSRAARR